MTVHPDDLTRLRKVADEAEQLLTELRARIAAAEQPAPMEEPTWLGAVVRDRDEQSIALADPGSDRPWWCMNSASWRKWSELKNPRPETAAERAERGAPSLLTPEMRAVIDTACGWRSASAKNQDQAGAYLIQVVEALWKAAGDEGVTW